MLWACVLLPQLALDGVLRRQPAAESPLALITGPAQRRTLHAVNAAAAEHGLHPGQALAAAHALLADFAIIEHDPGDAARQQALLAAWAYRYSSQVSIDFAEAVVLEVEASLGLFGPWPRFERALRADLTALGFSHRIALAPTPRAAWVLAGVHDGLAITQSTPLETTLAQVPVPLARLDVDIGEALHGMGLRKLGQLYPLPRAALAKRFGPALLDHLDRLRGDAPEPLALYRPPDRFDARVELAYEVESSQALLFPLRRLTGDLAAYLAGRDGGVQRFVVRLEHEGHPDTPVVIGLLAAERDPALLFELARGRLEQTQIPAPVRGMRLVAEELPPFVPVGRELFDERPAQAVPWEALRERLRARLGEDAVYALAPGDDHRPEQAVRRAFSPLPRNAGEGRGGGKSGADEAVTANRRVAPPPVGGGMVSPPRPTWLLPRPIPLRDPAPKILAGPERLETGWWDGDDVRRDYYVVETAAGQRAWAFCAPGERGPFMLHGWFA